MSEHGERSEHTGAPSELAATPANVEREGPDVAAVDAGVVLVAGAVLLRLALWALGEVTVTPADAADLASRAVGEVAALAQVLAPMAPIAPLGAG